MVLDTRVRSDLVREAIEVPFLLEVADDDGFDADSAEVSGELAGALPGHWVWGGGEPGVVVQAAAEGAELKKGVVVNCFGDLFPWAFDWIAKGSESIGSRWV